jgi:hypothetical protein
MQENYFCATRYIEITLLDFEDLIYINWAFVPAIDEDIIRFHLSAASAK